jgi:hypothetical protein
MSIPTTPTNKIARGVALATIITAMIGSALLGTTTARASVPVGLDVEADCLHQSLPYNPKRWGDIRLRERIAPSGPDRGELGICADVRKDHRAIGVHALLTATALGTPQIRSCTLFVKVAVRGGFGRELEIVNQALPCAQDPHHRSPDWWAAFATQPSIPTSPGAHVIIRTSYLVTYADGSHAGAGGPRSGWEIVV